MSLFIVRLVFQACLLVAFGAASMAYAQTLPPPGQSGAVEQSLQKKQDPKENPPKDSPKVVLQQRPEMKSADDAKTTLKVQRYRITGNYSIGSQELLAALSLPGGEVGGRNITLAEIKEEAARVTKKYRDEGYALAFAYVPAQDIKDGVVEIAVIEGKIDKILVNGNDTYSADFILDHVNTLQRQASMSLDDLERSMLTLNDYPGLTVRATLRQGDTPGTTDLYLTAEDKFPILVSLNYDNFGSENVGESRLGGSIEVINLFGIGHSVSFSGVSSLDAGEGELAYGRIGYVARFQDTTRISGFASFYDYEAKGDLKVLEPAGNGEVFGASLGHSLVRSHTFTLNADIGFEIKNLEQELIGVKTAEDRLRMLVTGSSVEWSDDWAGRWVGSIQARIGLGELGGGLEEDDPEASRLGADGEFVRFLFQIYRLQKVISWIHVIGKFSGQYAREPLVVSEQISIGGHDSVRGYPPFEFMGDRGYTATLEARFKLPFLEDSGAVFDMIQIAAFIDSGMGVREQPAFGERSKQVLSGAGVGLRLNYNDNASLRFDVGWPVSDKELSNGDDEVFYVSVIVNLH